MTGSVWKCCHYSDKSTTLSLDPRDDHCSLGTSKCAKQHYFISSPYIGMLCRGIRLVRTMLCACEARCQEAFPGFGLVVQGTRTTPLRLGEKVTWPKVLIGGRLWRTFCKLESVQVRAVSPVELHTTPPSTMCAVKRR